MPDDSMIGPGMTGFLVFLFLVIAAAFLFRSLNKQLKKVDFDENAPQEQLRPEPERPGN